MAAPPLGYFDLVSQAMNSPAQPLDLGAMAFGGAPPSAAPKPMMLGGVSAPPPIDAGPPPPPAAPPGPPMGREDPALGMSVMGPTSSQAPKPAPAPAPAPEAPAGRAPVLAPYLVGGGTVPAHEVDLRGPSLKAAQNQQNASFANAAQAQVAGGQEMAEREYQAYLEQERQARLRESAAQQSMAERDEEMAQRQADFDQSVKALSKAAIDPDRFWASRNTGQKVAAMIGMALGGFMQGARGGPNPALEIINTAIDRDIKAQEFAYNAMRDSANAKQTAFGMAMQKYQNIDAARAMARAAALDAAQAQIAGVTAQNKSTQAAMHGENLAAQLDEQKMQQIAQGVRFIPTQVAAPRYVIPGLPGTWTEAEVKAIAKEDIARNFELVKQDAAGENTLRTEVLKGQIANQGKTTDRTEEDAKLLAKEMQAAGIPAARASAEVARKAILAAPKTSGERIAEFTPVGSNAIGKKALFGKDVIARDQAWENFKNQAWKQIFGNVTAPEEARAKAAFEAAGDDESKLNAIKTVEEVLAQAEENIRRGVSEAGSQAYDNRRVRTGGAKPLSESISSFRPSGK